MSPDETEMEATPAHRRIHPNPRNARVVVDIEGEGFDLFVDEGDVVLRHPRWSLVGAGRSYANALRDLIIEIAAQRDYELSCPRSANEDLEAKRTYLRGFSLTCQLNETR